MASFRRRESACPRFLRKSILRVLVTRQRTIFTQTTYLYIAAALMDMSVGGVVFAIGRRAAELGATSFELGLLGSIIFGAYSIFAIIGGHISDRFGRRNVAMVGCTSAALLALACAFVTNVPALVGLSAVFGMGMGCFWPSIIAWLGQGLSGAALATRLSNFSVAWNLGLLVGFALTGVLFELGPRLAFFVSSGVLLVIAVLLVLAQQAAEPAAKMVASTTPEPHVPKGRGFRKTAWLANFAVNFSQAGATALFPMLATTLGIRADIHGGLLALGRGAALVVFFVMQHVGFWRSRLWPLWVAQLVCVAGIWWIGVTSNAWAFAVIFAVIGAVSGVTYQASIYFTLEEMSEKGKGGGFHEAILGSGMFLGPILAGWIGKQAALHGHSELRAPYFFCAISLLLLVVIQLAIVLWRRTEHPATNEVINESSRPTQS